MSTAAAAADLADSDYYRFRWHSSLKKCCEWDQWGQVFEATEGYKGLVKELEPHLGSVVFQHFDITFIRKVHAAIELRLDTMDDLIPKVTAQEMTTLVPIVNQLFTGSLDLVPEPLNSKIVGGAKRMQEVAPKSLRRKHGGSGASTQDELIASASPIRPGGTLLPPPPPPSNGDALISIKVIKIGMKDATLYMDPFITVTVRDNNASEVEASQDLPPSREKLLTNVPFGDVIHIQTPLQQMPEGSAIFFEFKHYKPGKEKISTKAWSLLEIEEIEAGSMALEIYAKPTDIRRKKFSLMSVKPLYLHLEITLQR